MKTFFLGIMAMVASCAMAQDADPVIMTINGKPVLRSEFVYSYNKNNGEDVIDHKTVEEYVELFVNYKRKVEAALDAHLDTLTSYNKEFRQYRDQQLLPSLVSNDDIEKETKKIYDQTAKRIGPDGLVDVAHILLRVPQNAEEDDKAKAEQRADSIYNAIMKGADFAELARTKSEDPGSARNGGRIGQIEHGQTLEVFDKAAFALKDGEVSKPVLSEVGYHIIKMIEHKQFPPFDSVHQDILQFIEKRNIRDAIARERVKNMAAAAGKTEMEMMDAIADSASVADADTKYLIKEYHDGLLLYEISNREVWEKAAQDTKGQEAFFKKNKKKYTWDAPRFKGIAYHTRDIADVEAVKKSLKGKSFDKWVDILRTTFNKDSVLRIRVEKGVFKKGDNGLVDKNEFGVADAKVKEIKDFPNTATYGKVIKTPEEMSDVKAAVIADYQDAMEKDWLKQLAARYPFTLNKEVLATVKEEK